MNMVDYILERSDLLTLIKKKSQGPEAIVAEMDDLPYDYIRVYDKTLQKCVEIDDDTFIPVLYLLGLTEKDFDGKNPELEQVWRAYMSQIDMEEYEMDSLLDSARIYMEEKERKKELLKHVRAN